MNTGWLIALAMLGLFFLALLVMGSNSPHSVNLYTGVPKVYPPSDDEVAYFIAQNHPEIIINELCKVTKNYRKSREKNPSVYANYTSSNEVDIDFHLTASVEMKGERYNTKLSMMQMRLDLGTDQAEVAQLVDAMKDVPEDVLITMWRAKYGEGGVAAEAILNDVTGSALFERLGQHMNVERIYDSYKHTLFFKLKNPDAGS